jgi:MFS transporter, ACDE family, multidrug resistance protein
VQRPWSPAQEATGSGSRRHWPLYAGGFLGPFGGAMATPMLPELSRGLHTSLGTAAWALTAYMIPFAALMLVSGTFGERWGRARTVQVAYVGYALASVACALAPSAPLFLAGRAAQGAANAFTSPLLVASISDAVEPGALGRALGRFGSLQAAGQAFAPLVGGAAAAVDYRWAFVASAGAAAGLALLPPPDAPRERPPGAEGAPDAGRWRALANRRLAVSCTVAFCMYVATTGLQLLVALRSGDRFGLGPDARGLVVAAFGTAGLLTGARLGRLADRFGARRFGIAALAAFGSTVLLAGVVPVLWLLVGVVAGAGAAATACRVAVNALAVRSTPGNRGGATSMTLAWQFLGAALAPVALLPLYTGGPVTAFAAAAGVLVPAAAVLASSRG